VIGVIFLLVLGSSGLAQEQAPTATTVVPAATRSEMDCAGFITAGRISDDIYVLDGADNDQRQPLRQFAPGDYIYLRSRAGRRLSVGSEYTLVRPGDELMRLPKHEAGVWSFRSLGTLYEDLGKAKVVAATPAGAVALVTSACRPINPGDLALADWPRPIPEYSLGQSFDRFAPPNGKMLGTIVATANNTFFLGTGTIGYINLGKTDGAQPGQRYRIFHVHRGPEQPRESIGELVILSTYKWFSTAIVVSSLREIALGDGVELE